MKTWAVIRHCWLQLLPALPLFADPIPGLFNTGVSDSGTRLPGGAVDPHYRLIRSADFAAPGPNAYVVNEGYPIPPWLGNGPSSKWIAPQASQSTGNRPGDYTYRLAFDLTGLDPATAVISGRWSSDNAGVAVLLNGVSAGIQFDGNFADFSPTFTITSRSVGGTNTLDFVVNNAGSGLNPTGFRAELSGRADPLPPPGTMPVNTQQPANPSLAYEPLGPSSRRTGIAISEIMYHPAPRLDGRNAEFLELYNSNPFFEDLSGWRITGEVDFTFPAGALLAGNSFLVVAAIPEDIRVVYGITNLAGGFTGAFPNDAGTMRLLKRSGAVVLEVNYSDHPPWPVAADGAGHSLVLARPSYGERDPRAWTASNRVGGSPGKPDARPGGPLENIVLNEWLAHAAPGQRDYVELFNHGPQPADLSGVVLRGGATNRFRIPEGTVLAAHGFVVLDQAQLGFELDAEGQRILLFTPDETRVIDGLRFGGQQWNMAFGRHPDGAARFQSLSVPTPGATNAAPLVPEIVINEIMYHPIAGGVDGEFIELFNRGVREVDLSGWRFEDGIDFTIPAGTKLPSGGWLVIARNAERLRSNHPTLLPSLVVGDFEGSLANDGERVALARPEIEVKTNAITGQITANHFFVVVDEVAYGDGGRWGRWADGGGSSLELIDPKSDNWLAPNWADSDESGQAPWTMVEATGVLDLPHPGVTSADQLQVLLLGSGEALADNVEVLTGGANRISNGTFESGVSGWYFQGTHRLSRWETAEGFQSQRSLRLAASDRGDHVANRARTRLTTTIPQGRTATIRAQVRWLRGHPEILFRLRGGALEATARLTNPASQGTPGASNGRSAPNAGPAITEVTHRPILPEANQPIRVTARVHDPDGVATVILRYRFDPDPNFTSLAMSDDATEADEFAGDGVFTGQIPGPPTGRLIAFHVQAADTASPSVTVLFPQDAPARECLVRVGELNSTSAFGAYRIWLTKASHDFWARREKMSNEDVDATFVYGTNRVIYNLGAHYSGSSYTAPIYNSPTGALCGYDLNFPEDDRFLGETQVTLDWPVRDDTDQREQLMFWFLDQFGLPNMYRRYVHLFVNGIKRGTIYDDVQQPGADTIREWFPDDDEGSLWKTDCWNEFDDGGNRNDPCVLNTLEPWVSGGVKKAARYRWNWRPRAVRGSANDFSDLFALVDAVNAAGSRYLGAVESVVDVDHWMCTFAMNDLASYWDGFGNPNAKNTFLYKPERGPWKLFGWDFDVGLGVFNDPVNAALFDVNDAAISRMYRTPAFVRRYWAALDEALNGFFQARFIDPILDSKYAAFRANNIALSSPGVIKSWINQRRSFLLNQLNTVRAPFAITSHGGADFSTNRESITLAGTAPVRVRALRVNGVEQPINWSTITNWNLTLSLSPAENPWVVEGIDRFGNLVAGASDTIRVRFTGSTAGPGDLRLVQILLPARDRVTLTWPASPGRTYRVRYKDSLSAANWNDLPGDVTTTTATASKTDAMVAGRDQRYYQVTLLP